MHRLDEELPHIFFWTYIGKGVESGLAGEEKEEAQLDDAAREDPGQATAHQA